MTSMVPMQTNLKKLRSHLDITHGNAWCGQRRDESTTLSSIRVHGLCRHLFFVFVRGLSCSFVAVRACSWSFVFVHCLSWSSAFVRVRWWVSSSVVCFSSFGHFFRKDGFFGFGKVRPVFSVQSSCATPSLIKRSIDSLT